MLCAVCCLILYRLRETKTTTGQTTTTTTAATNSTTVPVIFRISIFITCDYYCIIFSTIERLGEGKKINKKNAVIRILNCRATAS